MIDLSIFDIFRTAQPNSPIVNITNTTCCPIGQSKTQVIKEICKRNPELAPLIRVEHKYSIQPTSLIMSNVDRSSQKDGIEDDYIFFEGTIEIDGQELPFVNYVHSDKLKGSELAHSIECARNCIFVKGHGTQYISLRESGNVLNYEQLFHDPKSKKLISRLHTEDKGDNRRLLHLVHSPLDQDDSYFMFKIEDTDNSNLIEIQIGNKIGNKNRQDDLFSVKRTINDKDINGFFQSLISSHPDYTAMFNQLKDAYNNPESYSIPAYIIQLLNYKNPQQQTMAQVTAAYLSETTFDKTNQAREIANQDESRLGPEVTNN